MLSFTKALLAALLSAAAVSAADCGGKGLGNGAFSTVTENGFNAIKNDLCKSFTAGGGAYTLTWDASALCVNCHGQMQLQPGTTNTNCEAALRNIWDQCMNDGFSNGIVLPVYNSGTWQLGGEWYYLEGTVRA